MSLSLYDPFFSFNDVWRLFDDALNVPTTTNQQVTRRDSGERTLARGFTPRVDIHESPEQNRVTATFELPGLTRDDIKIEVQNGRLVISGEQTISKDVEERGFVHRERNYGRFSRAVPLPQGAKPEEIQAKLENGLLTVTYPKTSAEQQAQRIAIA
ncbi:HSP20-like chaperone [Sanghuangporus baumii]|uniref:HSP20-like chaperone n=1 Tax=Sanghuangporus baumii TaxID=108892 RepID=A0A9Q5HWG6_SANBA|nr:HSP20-like chaperone [Sanghuangporus baumii]